MHQRKPIHVPLAANTSASTSSHVSPVTSDPPRSEDCPLAGLTEEPAAADKAVLPVGGASVTGWPCSSRGTMGPWNGHWRVATREGGKLLLFVPSGDMYNVHVHAQHFCLVCLVWPAVKSQVHVHFRTCSSLVLFVPSGNMYTACVFFVCSFVG